MYLDFTTVDALCKAVDMSIKKPHIDLSRITFFRPFALIYLGMFLRYHNSQGTSFVVSLPNSSRARNYLARQNFWERFNFNPEVVQRERLRCFSTSTSLNDIIDVERHYDIAEEITRQVRDVLARNSVKVRIGLISEIACELVDNFAIHSECTLAAVAMQYYPNLGRILFAIGDCGIGIRASLIRNPRYSYLAEATHYEAALKSFDPLVSCLSSGGTGLTEVRDQVINLNGRLILATGDGYVIITKDDIRYGLMAYNLPGVQMELSFSEEVAV
jgi:hypothetical protein